MLRFNANLFRLAFTCASNEETRYYLKGVYVEPHAQGGVTLTATDGHRMIVIRDETGFADESAIVALGDGLKACKPKRDERRDVVIYTGENKAQIVLTLVDDKGDLADTPLAMAYDVRIDGSFPNYRNVVPQKFCDKGAPAFRGSYLSAFAELAADLVAHAGIKVGKYDTNRPDSLRVICTEDDRPNSCPALILFPAPIDFAFGVLMPVGADKNAKLAPPAWFLAPAAPTAQAAE